MLSKVFLNNTTTMMWDNCQIRHCDQLRGTHDNSRVRIYSNPVLTIEKYQHCSNYHINWNLSHPQCIQFFVAYCWIHRRDIRSPVCSRPLSLLVECEIFPWKVRLYIYLLLYRPHIRIPYIRSNYCHQPSSVPIFFQFPSYSPSLQTAKYFISRPKFSSILFTHHASSAEHFFFHILYLFLFCNPHIRIPYIILIIINLNNHWLLMFISLPPLLHNRPWNISSSDLSSVQLLSPIISHQQSKVHSVIRFCIHW